LGDTNAAEKDRQQAFERDKQLEGAPHVELPTPLPPVKKDPEPETGAKETANPDRDRLAGLLARGRQLFMQGRGGDVGPVADEALTIDPESPGALGLRAAAKFFRRDVRGARDDINAALKLDPETFSELVIRTTLNGSEGKYDDAIADATIAIRLDPTQPVPWALRALGYLEKKEYRQAVHDDTEAINHGSSVADSRLTRAGAYAYLGQ
jgi:Tfp pilus assembly protein PilF